MNSQDQQFQQNYVPNNLSNGLGIASFVLAILGFLTAFIVIGILLDIIAIILGVIAIASKKQKSGLGIAGVIIATISILLMIFIGSLFSSKTDTSSIESAEIRTEQSDSSASAENAPSESEESTETSEEEIISEQVLLEYEGLKITAKEIVTDSIWGEGLKLLIENNSETSLGVGCNALIINDYMITDLFSSTIAAGKKSNENMYFSSSQLEAAGISNVGKIEVYFRIYDAESYRTIYDADCVTIQTSEYENLDTTSEIDGTELLNRDGVRIIGKYVDENSFWGAAVLLYIENNTGRNIGVRCDDMSINGFMVTPYFSSTVYDTKMSIDDITIMSSDLEKNEIDKISDIELKFRVYDSDSHTTIFETDPINFSVN